MGHPAIAEIQNKEWFPKELWLGRHEQLVRDKDSGPVDLLFLGDSITEGWLGAGKGIWDKRYAPRRAVDIGIGGDETQHVLWRLANGGIAGINPKVVVLLIGTNNLGNSGAEAEPTIEGIRAIVKLLREKLPTSKILLLGVFPRDEHPGTKWRKDIQTINRTISALDDGKHVRFLDLTRKFTNSDGTIPADVMPDYLHLTEKGYQIWADAMEDSLKELLGETGKH